MSDESTIKTPAGFYKGRAIAGSEQFSINEKSGNEQVAIDVEVPELGRNFTVIFSFSDKAAPYALEKLRACGWKGDDVTRLDGVADNEVSVSIKYEVWEGKERMKVDISTVGGGRVVLDNPMSEAQKRGFAARMKVAAKSVGTSPKPVAAPKPTPRASGPVGPSPRDNDADENFPDFLD